MPVLLAFVLLGVVLLGAAVLAIGAVVWRAWSVDEDSSDCSDWAEEERQSAARRETIRRMAIAIRRADVPISEWADGTAAEGMQVSRRRVGALVADDGEPVEPAEYCALYWAGLRILRRVGWSHGEIQALDPRNEFLPTLEAILARCEGRTERKRPRTNHDG